MTSKRAWRPILAALLLSANSALAAAVVSASPSQAQTRDQVQACNLGRIACEANARSSTLPMECLQYQCENISTGERVPCATVVCAQPSGYSRCTLNGRPGYRRIATTTWHFQTRYRHDSNLAFPNRETCMHRSNFYYRRDLEAASRACAAGHGDCMRTAKLSPGEAKAQRCAKAPDANVDWSECEKRNANLRGANLAFGKLAYVKLAGANLAGANLSGADLTAADLTGANLAGANLERAKLRGASLRSANLTGAKLTGADLRSAGLWNAKLAGAVFHGANLDDAWWTNGQKCRDPAIGRDGAVTCQY